MSKRRTGWKTPYPNPLPPVELPLEMAEDGWKILSRSPWYAMHPDGRLFPLVTKTIPKPWKNPDGYMIVGFIGKDGKHTRSSIHRLLMETFVPIPDELKHHEKLVVNHIDAIRDHNELSNLEWTTYRGNNLHAGMMGRTNRWHPMLVLDLETDQELFFESAIEYGRQHGLTKDAVLYRLRTDGQRVFPERRLYKMIHSPTPWMQVPEDLLIEFGVHRKVNIKLLETGEVKTFDTQKDLARWLNRSEGFVSQWLNTPGQPVCPGCFLLKYVSDRTPWREVMDPWGELADGGLERPIIVKEVETDKVSVYGSLAQVGKVYGMGITTVHYRVSAMPGKVKKGLAMGYYPKDKGSVLAATLK